MDYTSSSHISSWIFTSKQLSELRTRANNEARRYLQKEQVKKRHQQQLEQQQQDDDVRVANEAGGATSSTSGSSTPLPVSFAKGYAHRTRDHDMPMMTEASEPKEELPFLSPPEETTLLNFYATKLFSLIGPKAQHPPLRRDIKVASTAALLLRRFYLSNSVMVYDPKVFMVASAFLATKIEDCTVNIKYLEEGTKLMKAHVPIPEIIKSEIHLAAGIDYDLFCLHPYKTVEAYTEDLRTFLKSKEGSACCVNRTSVGSADLLPLYEEAKNIVEQLATTDVPLIATAGKIGLVAMKTAMDTVTNRDDDENQQEGIIEIDFRNYLKIRFGGSRTEKEIEDLWSEIEGLCATIKELSSVETENMIALKEIHKKFKKCRGGGDEKKKKKKKRKRNDTE
mmetsp:Transcript_15767/g.19225  ORF Transcript_15767/g.19225 Transcript_15767/m.19225 type:complete len:395 (+) Transcript_15767:84-1268(+)